MRILVITGGPIYDEAAIFAKDCDLVYCADSGADFAFRNSIKPDKVFGDFDSVSAEGKVIIDKLQIPLEIYPEEKDETDTEIILNSLSKDDEILLVCSLTGRIDHVTANLGLLITMRQKGYQITATDGVTDIIPMSGKDEITLEFGDTTDMAVSLMPMDFENSCTNVKSEGLYYELNGIDLKAGRTLSFSNKMKPDSKKLKLSMDSGNLLICITSSVS